MQSTVHTLDIRNLYMRNFNRLLYSSVITETELTLSSLKWPSSLETGNVAHLTPPSRVIPVGGPETGYVAHLTPPSRVVPVGGSETGYVAHLTPPGRVVPVGGSDFTPC